MRRKERPYRVIGAYDSETCNVETKDDVYAFPILHQLGLLDVPLVEISPDNVEKHTEIELYRHTLDFYNRLDELVSVKRDFVPVICCHNLSFDMYGLSGWLSRHDVRVLAKSQRKPITFTVLDDGGNPVLVIWDTLIFNQRSLERMGEDCAYPKAVGEWDYSLTRTPETPLTENELHYAKRDVYVLLCWLGWWLRRNPDIDPEKLGLNVVTKTGVVRERRRVRFDQVKGNGRKQNIGRYWLYMNRTQLPKSDDELFTMQAATRGGFTFCSNKNASVAYVLDDTTYVVAGFDATSMHPAQMVSHRYPVDFVHECPRNLQLAFDIVRETTIDTILDKWVKPFPVAFYGCFEFTNLRPKAGSIYERFGIFPLASARYKSVDTAQLNDDNGDKPNQDEYRQLTGYADCGSGVVEAFGKVISADAVRVYLTELGAFEVCTCYDFDSMRSVDGYLTGRFVRPTDMSTVSVMQFYKAKNVFKVARETYFKTGKIGIDLGAELENLGIAKSIVSSMETGTLSDSDVDATYMMLKSDLNSLYGIECSNEFRRDTVLDVDGIMFQGSFGVCNAPKNPKAWYQFGQRIVGWSRIAQICAMELAAPHVETIINGDTDSLKVLIDEREIPNLEKAFGRYASAVDKAKENTLKRVKASYPSLYDPLDGIGHYELEFMSKRFCASWNKSYVMQDIDKRDGKRHYSFTIAGIPTKRRISSNSCFIGVDGYADMLDKMGWSFEQVCNVFLGYDVTYSYDLIRLNARKFPQWNVVDMHDVTDCLGNKRRVMEPASLALYPMTKTVNSTSSADNRHNLAFAVRNNPNVNTRPLILHSKGIYYLDEVI